MKLQAKSLEYEIPKHLFKNNIGDYNELKNHLLDLDMKIEEKGDGFSVICLTEELNLFKDTLKIYSKEDYNFSEQKIAFLEKLNEHIRTIDYSIGEHLFSILQGIATKNKKSVSFLLETEDKDICSEIDKSIKKEK